MRYFQISNGLRGCYMPDNAFIVAVEALYELKVHIQHEANAFKDAGFMGGNKIAVARLAREAWNIQSVYPHVLPMAPMNQRPANYSHGIFCIACSEHDYNEYVEEEGL